MKIQSFLFYKKRQRNNWKMKMKFLIMHALYQKGVYAYVRVFKFNKI
ncbi:hypothetical protein SAMN02745912_01137 [Paramaledivibacter caminithermalis DSM 15212]|jgi:hypothetical protein|uniref:Uncharacterized protein n=1 Tax=Paramaledivibacter caminithermalis (strain DSM 15212 / CIP 107654 / DViRD3) TaxID=1121301 RepID=A0A1M6M9C2_PARC5|nr:hypothetical protein SAMN02745912_01137 [Paramaledivibacter caminithermalis DSM 15212]